jgi:hypothetical protein
MTKELKQNRYNEIITNFQKLSNIVNTEKRPFTQEEKDNVVLWKAEATSLKKELDAS